MPRNLLPQPIRDAWRDGRTHDARRAVVLFVDVAGFTALSERLMTRGSAGAELLAGAMQTLFDPMVARVHHWGGFVATFAGDAFTAVLPWSDDVARRGRALAEEIRQQVAERAELEVEGSTFAIAVKLGLAAGPVRWERSTATPTGSGRSRCSVPRWTTQPRPSTGPGRVRSGCTPASRHCRPRRRSPSPSTCPTPVGTRSSGPSSRTRCETPS